ncbi:MAG: rRNA pseudouridine synthase [Deltaproteobacteria bacterium]|nr:rRNA pseudouridine synthase [Deltaproteobacteria bacterium]
MTKKAHTVRLNAHLAHCGVASRRKSDRLIESGHVTINGKIVRQMGTIIDPQQDKVAVDGVPVRPERHVYYLLNKPRGVVSAANDPDGKQTVVDIIRNKKNLRLYPVGRLDIQSEGALILTNDGALTAGLLHPSNQIPRTYLARVRGQMSTDDIHRIERGIRLEDGPIQPDSVLVTHRTSASTWVEIVLHEGRNRIVRRIFEAMGHQVARLIRTSFASLTIEDMAPGRYRNLTPVEVYELKRLLQLIDDVERNSPKN